MHIGLPEGVMLLEFEPVKREVPWEVQPHGEPEEGGQALDLPECLDHQPSTFLKGKPWSILSLLRFYKTLI
jgi:hypothetical protein